MRAGFAARVTVGVALGCALAPSPGRAEPWALLVGRVTERGTRRPIAGAHVLTAGGESALTDEDGRFQIRLAPGPVAVRVFDDTHEPAASREQLAPERATLVEYKLLRRPERYSTTVAGEPRHEGERRGVDGEEVRTLAGALGDPVRAAAMLPGVTLPYPLAPVVVIRGAEPGTVGFFLDGVPVPQLFHILVGDGMFHPETVARVDLYPSGYGASFGRYSGGILDAETRPAGASGLHGVADLKLFEASALAETELPRDAHAMVAARYGFPNWILHRFVGEIDLTYWDYLARFDRRGLTVEVFGANDSLTLDSTDPRTFRLTMHRAQIREREHVGGADVEAAIWGGFDEMEALTGGGVRKLALGLRSSVRRRWGRFRLSAGVDGELSRFTPQDFREANATYTLKYQDEFGELGQARTGVVAGAYVEGSVDVLPGLALTLGGRADVYHAGGVTLLGLDPRTSLRARLTRRLSLRAAFGLYQQPPSFPIGLPGLDTFALSAGLQRAWQATTSIDVEMPAGFAASLSGYYHRYQNLSDPIVSIEPPACALPPPPSLTGLPARLLREVSGQSYGLEALVRRQTGRFTGWIGYSLARAERLYACGFRPSDFDQTHLLHVVLQARLPWRLHVGAHLYYASGRPATVPELSDPLATLRNNVRLPDYVQLDLRIDREWIFDGWTLTAVIEVLNVTYSRSVFGLFFPPTADPAQTILHPPAPTGFNWILPSVGLRGRF